MTEMEDYTDRVAQAIFEKVMKKLPRPHFEPGTVMGYHEDNSIAGARARVRLASDDPDTSHSLPVLVSARLKEGDRVMVVFDPPQGGYVIGSLGSGIPCASAFIPVQETDLILGTTALNFYEEYTDATDPSNFFYECGGFEVLGTTIIVPDDGIYSISAQLAIHHGFALEEIYSWRLRTSNERAVGQTIDLLGVGPIQTNIDMVSPNVSSAGPISVHLNAGDTLFLEVSLTNAGPWVESTEVLSGVNIEQLCCGEEPFFEPEY